MATDDERREVAERLRRAWANVPDKNPVRHQLRVLFEIYSAVGLADDDDADAIDLFDRLADLIELAQDHFTDPGEKVDREALLALAEDVEEAAAMATVMDASEGVKMLAEMLLDIARRIREACGEED